VKKLILVLLFSPIICLGQTYNSYGRSSQKVTVKKETTNSFGETTYEIETEDVTKPYDGAYENPGRNRQVKDRTAEIYRQSAKELSEAGAKLGKAIIDRVEEKNEMVVPLKVNLNAFKYIVFNRIDPNGGKAASRGVVKNIKKYLLNQGYNVIVRTEKKLSKNDLIPEDLKLNPTLALYITIWAKDNLDGFQANLMVLDYEGNLVHQKKAVNAMSSVTVCREISSELTSNKFSYKPNTDKYLFAFKKQNTEQKDYAIKELKNLKELLDMEIITKEEFDNKAAELKKIILDN